MIQIYIYLFIFNKLYYLPSYTDTLSQKKKKKNKWSDIFWNLLDTYKGHCFNGLRCKHCAFNIHSKIHLFKFCFSKGRKKCLHKIEIYSFNIFKVLNIWYNVYFDLNSAILFMQNLEDDITGFFFPFGD